MTTLTRRDLVLTGSALAVAAASRAVGRDAGRRPNIVWIVCHDIHAPLLGCYGNALARTPTIDALARDGVRYDHAYSTAPVCAPSRFALLTGAYAQSCAPAHQMRANGPLPEAFKPLPLHLRSAGYYCTNNVFTDYNVNVDPDSLWNECSPKAHWRNRAAGQPFFCVYNYLITHESRLFETGRTETDPARVSVPPFLPDLPEIREALARNIDMVNRQDQAVAHLLGELAEDGLAEDTIVFFMADHGGLHPRSKRYCYEDGLRVPLIVRVPEAFRSMAGVSAGTPSQQLVSHVDLAPTTLALAGLPVPAAMMGRAFLGGGAAKRREYAFSVRDRMDERYDLVHTVHDGKYRYLRNYDPHRIYGQYQSYEWQSTAYQAWERAHLSGTLDTEQDRFWNTKPVEELYDTTLDPHEIRNLAADGAHRQRLESLRRALDAHLLSIVDNSFIPEGASGEGYEPSRRQGAYPLARVLGLANLGLRRDPANAARFQQGLDDPHELIRFWSARGLMLLPSFPPAAIQALEARLAKEPVARVRCAIAEALILSGRTEAALAALSAMLVSDADARLQLRALNALTLMAPAALSPVRAGIERITRSPDEYLARASKYLVMKIDGTYSPSVRIVASTGGGSGPPSAAQLAAYSDPQI